MGSCIRTSGAFFLSQSNEQSYPQFSWSFLSRNTRGHLNGWMTCSPMCQDCIIFTDINRAHHCARSYRYLSYVMVRNGCDAMPKDNAFVVVDGGPMHRHFCKKAASRLTRNGLENQGILLQWSRLWCDVGISLERPRILRSRHVTSSFPAFFSRSLFVGVVVGFFLASVRR